MIRIQRSAVTPPAVLTETGQAGALERTKACSFYMVIGNRSKPLPGGFKVYKHADVRTALHELFSGKCAYCETRYTAVHPVDIEHYRPKAAVVHDSDLRKPGYYWLAADWENLLPSCIDCNRSRRHRSIDLALDPTVSGKANLFPISNENKRAEYPDEERHERRLILDPCRDQPDKHFTFAEDGLILSRTSKGTKSIEVYGLNRVELVEERLKIRKQVLNQMLQVNYAFIHAKRDQTALDKRALANGLLNLFIFSGDDQNYLGLTRPLVEDYVNVMARNMRRDFPNEVPHNQAARKTVDAYIVRHCGAAADPLEELRGI